MLKNNPKYVNRCKYGEIFKVYLHSISCPILEEDKFQSQILKLKTSCYRYLHGGGLLSFLCQKRLCKIKYPFKGSVSNVYLGLFYLNNQLLVNFVTFWFF